MLLDPLRRKGGEQQTRAYEEARRAGKGKTVKNDSRLR